MVRRESRRAACHSTPRLDARASDDAAGCERKHARLVIKQLKSAGANGRMNAHKRRRPAIGIFVRSAARFLAPLFAGATAMTRARAREYRREPS